MREFFWMHFAIAAACGYLGRSTEGLDAAAEMTRLAPFLADADNLREFVARWYWVEDMNKLLIDGVRRSAEGPDRSADATTNPALE
jgi:hypothetical protein